MRIPILLAAILALHPVLASAQELESLAGVRLDFDRAGARALAMGATGVSSKSPDAAAMNPAAIAGADRSFSILAGRRTMEGRYIADNTLRTTALDSTTSGLQSASVTLPMAGLTWSFFYDQPIDVSHSTLPALPNGAGTSTPFYFCDGHLSAEPCDFAVVFGLPAALPLETSLSLQRYGAAAAWSRGPFALGASLRQERLHQQSGFSNDRAFSTPSSGITETTDDSSLTWNAGLTWDLAPNARLGAAYASGGSFRGNRTFLNGAARPIEFRTPSSASVGLSFDPIPQLTLATDVVRIQYSEMMHDHRALFPGPSEIGYRDATELHAGAEYRRGTVALRAGWWRDPAHALSILNGVSGPPPFQYIAAIVDSDEDHLTAGIGVGVKTRFDASVDRGSRGMQLALGVSTKF
jgi:hypothetical protein